MKDILLMLLLLPVLGFSQSAESVLKKSIAYHDPQGMWPTLTKTLIFEETRPEGPNRKTAISMDNSASFMKINRNDEEVYEIVGENAKVLQGGKPVERALMLRNYYLYLWGLPMKLMDPGTPTPEKVADEEVSNIPCYVLRVAYEKDTWYFYFEKSTGRLVQYKFYQDEGESKGELITLDGEFDVDGIKVPNNRSWFTLPDNKYLGTDILKGAD